MTRNHEVIFHLALIGIPYSYNVLASYIGTNVSGTFNVLHASRVSTFRRDVKIRLRCRRIRRRPLIA
jgi:nucleoside-diphosphate-sugar epimerase